MEFEHYIQQGQQKLRCGYTTGTCAALAGKAAVRMLLGGQKTEEISVLTPKGLWVTTAVEEIQSGDGWVSCGVRKDAGDDIDVTAQSLICVKAKKTAGTKIVIDGGIGVGRVTKPGLEQPVGASAINSVPRRMILQEAERSIEKQAALTTCFTDGKRALQERLVEIMNQRKRLPKRPSIRSLAFRAEYRFSERPGLLSRKACRRLWIPSVWKYVSEGHWEKRHFY